MNNSAQFEVNIDCLNNNINKLFNHFSDYKYKIADLRNNAFGMGIYVIKYIALNNFDYAFTTTLKDAIDLRKYSSDISILISKSVEEDYIYDAINNNVTLTVDSLDYLKLINSLELRDELKIHILINNGANLNGLNIDELISAIGIINENKYIKLEGIYTNITTYGIEDINYYQQITNFEKILANIDTSDLIIHANEPIMYHKKKDFINGVKFDVSMWGLVQNVNNTFSGTLKKKKIDSMFKSDSFEELNLDLDIVFAITAIVEKVIDVKKGSLVGRSYTATDDMKVAIINAGHKDGITKALKVVVVNQSICNVLTDDIDIMYISAPDNVEIGDKVYLISDYNNIDSVLQNLKTNRYYLLSILNTNLKRVYINQNNEEELYY